MVDEQVQKCLTTKGLIETYAMVSSCISVTDVEDLITLYRRYDATGPIIDPTGYRNAMRTAPQHYKLAEAFLKFRKTVEEIEHEGKGRSQGG